MQVYSFNQHISLLISGYVTEQLKQCNINKIYPQCINAVIAGFIGPNIDDFSAMHPNIQRFYRGQDTRLRSINEWILMDTLGMGGYSKVKLGLHCKTGQTAALKTIFADQSGKMSESRKKQLIRELNIMKKVNHPNVTKLIAFNADAKYPEANGKYTPCIVITLEFAAGGELFDYLMFSGHFDDCATRSYFKQLIDGLNAMYTAGIAYHDLSPENLLLDKSLTLKISDFGFPTQYCDKQELMNASCGSKSYLAPEFWRGETYSHKSHIFATGIILFTMYAGFPPIREANCNDWFWIKFCRALEMLKRANEIRRIIKKNASLKDANSAQTKQMVVCVQDARKQIQLFWKAHCKKRQFDDDDFKDIVLNLIHPNPNKRMEIKQIVTHKWFTKGPFYTSDALKVYLTKRLKTVMCSRQRKIRKLIENTYAWQRPTWNHSRNCRCCNTESIIMRRIRQIDPDNAYDSSCQTVKDALFPDTTFQFLTDASPAEIAVRIEFVATKYQANINISPSDNLITIQCGFAISYNMPDGTEMTRQETIMFCVKQFFIDRMPKLRKGQHLFDKDNVTYLVLFKRLQGSFDAYSKIIRRFMENENLREQIKFDDGE